MQYLPGYIRGFIAGTMMAVLAGCSLSDPGPSTTSAPLTLDYEQNLSLILLSWDKVNVTGFKEYIILHSTKPIPASPTPEVSQEVTVLKRIDDLDITSLSVPPTLLSAQVCYKLYCAVDDRFLSSDNLCIDAEIDVVEGFYEKACHLAGNDEAVMFDRINHRLTSIQYRTGTISSTVTDIVLNFPSMEMTTWNNVTHVFASEQSPAWLRKYALPSLTASNTKSFNDILWASNVHNDLVFIATQDFTKGFQVLSRNNLNTLDSRTGIFNNQFIAVFPGSPATVLTLGASESKKYLVDDTGKITGEDFISARVSQPDQQHNCADGSTLFIGGQNGTIINREGENVTSLNANVNAFIQLMRLTPDETKVVYLINVNGEIHLEVADLTSLPSTPLLVSHIVPQMNYADIIPDGDVIYLIGTSFTGSQPQTFILKYPLPS